jgi:hypothetical protein
MQLITWLLEKLATLPTVSRYAVMNGAIYQSSAHCHRWRTWFRYY